MKEITIHLSTPVIVGGKPLTELSMREPTVGTEEDAMSMALNMERGGNMLTNEICMYSMMSGVPYDVLRGLSRTEYQKLRRAYDELTRPTAGSATLTGSAVGTPEANSAPSGTAS